MTNKPIFRYCFLVKKEDNHKYYQLIPRPMATKKPAKKAAPKKAAPKAKGKKK